jgi:hypothetical protein
MRKKLISKEDEKKKQKRNQWIAGIVLVAVMFFSAFGIAVNSFGDSSTEKFSYKGYDFQKINSYYVLDLGEANFYFLTNPEDLESIDIESNILRFIPNYLSKPLYLSSEDSTSSQEIYQNLQPYVERIQLACLEGEECLDENIPIKNCTNNFIVIRESNENKIYEDKNCVFIEGKQEDLLTLTDKFILEIIGIK